jgi:hypothetical protein
VTTTGIVLGVVVLLVLVPVVAAVVYRLVVVRRTSTPALYKPRSEPGWGYGALKYSDTEASFYRLTSVRFGADLRIDRRSLVLGARRQPTGPELDVAEVGEMIVPVTGRDRRGEPVEGEFCMGPAELTALLAWVEACSTEQVRRSDRRRR